MILESRAGRPVAHALAVVMVAAATAVLLPLAALANETTVALAYVLLVLGVAAVSESGPAITAAVLSAAAYNYFFLEPVRTWTIADPRNWTALFTLLVVGIAVGELSRRVKRRAADAEASRQRAEDLLARLEEAFERESDLEAARRGERLKMALLDGVTHDLRTPLTAIKASVTALLADRSAPALQEPDRQELLEVVNEEADRLDALVGELIATARVASRGEPPVLAWSSLPEIIAAARTRVEPRLRGHQVDVVGPPEMPVVRADARAIEEAVFLLLDNAVKYAPPDSRIRVALTAGDRSVEIAVLDEGPGVAAVDRPRIFKPFTRGRAGADTPGLGMGLAIVRGIVEAHGGTVDVSDRDDRRGSRFTIRLPIGDDEDS